MFRKISGLALAFALSGCAGIPTSSAIKYGDEISSDTSSQFVRVIARPPIADMDPTALVQGFLDACADSTGNFAIAREYLAAGISNNWKPESGIDVYESGSFEFTSSSDQVLATATKLGAVSMAGHYEVAKADSKVSANFKISKDAAGQFRISELPDGIFLSSNDVDRSFRSFPLYFFNPDLTELVTDSVFVPVGSTGAATTLVRSLLSGPASYLSATTRNAFPAGTKLTYGSVPINSGEAQVDLSVEVLTADELTRRALAAQLVWTLSSLPNVSSVRITVSGQPLAVTDIGSLQTLSDWKAFSPFDNSDLTKLNVIRGNQIISISDQGSEIQVAGGSQTLSATAFDFATGRIAAVSSDGKAILANTSRSSTLNVVANGGNLARPTWDTSGNIMFADFGRGIFEINPKGEIRSVALDTTSLGVAGQVKQVALARDGIRIAAILSDGKKDELVLGSVLRNEAGSQIVGLHRVERSLTSIRDLTWKAQSTLAVLGSEVGGSVNLYNVSLIDGKEIIVSVPTDSQALAVDSRGQVTLSTSDVLNPSVFRQEFGDWKMVTKGQVAFFSN
jgi:spore germination protein GerM